MNTKPLKIFGIAVFCTGFSLLGIFLYHLNIQCKSKPEVKVIDPHSFYFGDSVRVDGPVLHLWKGETEMLFYGNWTVEMRRK